jgi:hypothetical protein
LFVLVHACFSQINANFRVDSIAKRPYFEYPKIK